MKKLFLYILFVFCFFNSFAQPIVNRSSSVITVQDGRLSGLFNLFVPRYSDTTAANLQLGVDSSGAIIFTYDAMNIWVRQHSPKKWVRIAGAGAGGDLVNIGSGYRLAVDETSNVKTIFPGYGMLIDSATNANALTFTVDSSLFMPNRDVLGYYEYPLLAPNDSTLAIDTGAGRSSVKTYVTTRHLVDSLIALGGGGTVTAANEGLSLSGTTVQFGQTVGAVGDPAVVTTDREIPFSGGSDFHFRESGTTNKVHINPAGQIFTQNALGGGMNMYVAPGAGNTNPGISYYKGLIGAATVIVASGLHWTPPDRHHYISDMRDSVGYASIESGGTSTINWLTGFDGRGHVTQAGLKGKWVFGSTLAHTAILGDVDNTGSTYLRDSLMYAKKMFITDSTGYDLMMSARASPYETKLITVPDLITLIGVPPTWNSIISPTGTQTLTFDDAELNAWTNGSNTETFHTITSNSLTTGTALSMTSSSISSGKIIDIAITGTAGLNNQAGINVSLSGNNSTSSQTTYGINVSNTHGGTGASSVGISSSATGALSIGGNFVGGFYGVYSNINTNGGIAIAANSYSSGNTTANAPVAQLTSYQQLADPVYGIIRLARHTNDAIGADDHPGGSIDFYVKTTDASQQITNQIVSKLSTSTTASYTSQFQILGVNAGAVPDSLFTIYGTGGHRLYKYGGGTFTGTPTFALSVDASGNIIETAAGGGSPFLPVTGTGTATGAMIGELAGNTLTIEETGNDLLSFINNGTQTTLSATDGTADTKLVMEGDGAGPDVVFRLTADDGTNNVQIEGDAVTQILALTANEIHLASTLAGSSVGWVWTLANTTTGEGEWAAAAAGGATWNAITDPTGDQALTFGAGESSTWTNSNTTEDLFTINSSTLTTGSFISLNSTSTALASGNNVAEFVMSGANGSSAITATGIRVSVTNTGTTSINNALTLTASGASTNNAINVTAGDTYVQGFKIIGNLGAFTGAGMEMRATSSSSFFMAAYNRTGGSYMDISFEGLTNTFKSSTATTALVTMTMKAGKVGVGPNITTPTAWLHLDPSTTVANTASLKLGEGSRQTTPEDGTINYVANNIEFTETSTVYTLAKTLTATATLDFGSTVAGTSTDLTITVTGAVDGDAISVGVPNGSTLANGVFTGWVSAANTVTIRFSNNSLAAALDPASGSFRVSVIRY